MASNKVITAEGKTKMLEYVFTGDNGFNYLALGNGESRAAETEDVSDFIEISDNDYQRVKLNYDDTGLSDSQSITLSAVFEDTNYAPSQGGYIQEIAIVNNVEPDESTDIFFAFAEVPKILKSDNISLKYTIVVSML